jgi:hypothetical protein
MPAPQTFESLEGRVAIKPADRYHAHLTFWAGGALCRRARFLRQHAVAAMEKAGAQHSLSPKDADGWAVILQL